MAIASLEEAERQLRSIGAPAHWENNCWDWVFQESEATIRAFIWPVVSRFLEDPDEDARWQAVYFIDHWDQGGTMTVDRLIEVMGTHADGWRASKMVDHVANALASASGRCEETRPRAAAALVKLLDGAPTQSGVRLLAQHELDVLIASASKYSEKDSDQVAVEWGARCLYGHPRFLEYLAALKGRTVEQRNHLMAELDESRKLPHLAIPPAEECRRALGL